MASNDEPDYKALFLKAEKEREQEVELRRQERELRRQERELRRQAEKAQRQERELNQQTTLEEFIRACHNLLS